MLSTITDSVIKLDEDYQNVYEENSPLPESLNVPGVSLSKQSFSEYDPTQSYGDDVEFDSWMSRQTELKENVSKVCDRYGKSLSIEVPLKEFMYDSKHKLLYCRNAKVNRIILLHMCNIINKLKGWNYNVADTLSRAIWKEKHSAGRVWTKLQ